ncbi:MAG: septum formation family protein [Microbacteriaceae bacterium]
MEPIEPAEADPLLAVSEAPVIAVPVEPLTSTTANSATQPATPTQPAVLPESDADTSGPRPAPFVWGLTPNNEADPLAEPVAPATVAPATVAPEPPPLESAQAPVPTDVLPATLPEPPTALPTEVLPAAAAESTAYSATPPATPTAATPPTATPMTRAERRRQDRDPATGVQAPAAAHTPAAAHAPAIAHAPAPSATRAAVAASGPRGPRGASIRRPTRALFWVAGALLLVLLLIGLFVFGTRLPTILQGAPAPTPTPTKTATATPTPTPTVAATGPQSPGTHAWDSLRGGECLQPFTTPWALTFTVVDCATPHAAQLVYAGVFATDATVAYPGVEQLASQINVLCSRTGILNLTAAAAFTDAQIQAAYPATQQQWQGGQRSYFCFVNRSAGEPLTGSVAGPGPS